ARISTSMPPRYPLRLRSGPDPGKKTPRGRWTGAALRARACRLGSAVGLALGGRLLGRRLARRRGVGTERRRRAGAQRRVADDFDAATALAEGGDVLGNGLVRHAVRSDGLGRGTSHESPSEGGGESRHLTRSALILQIKPPNLGQNAAIF